MKYDEQEIGKAFEVICKDFTEVRIIGSGFTASGYFKDANALIHALKQYANKEGVNFYMVLNKIDSACYSRLQMSKFVERPKETTSDKDIVRRDWLLIDLDCDRPSGVSSTDEELKLSRDKAVKIYKYLEEFGFSKPVVALSGNGMHLLYRIDLDNDSESTTLIKQCLLALDMMFSDGKVKIDTSVYNASRITKLYGTMASKGQSTLERPHRLSKILNIPENLKETPTDILARLAMKVPAPPPKPAYKGQQSDFDMETWLDSHNVAVKAVEPYQGGLRYKLQECPFDPSHQDAAVFVLPNGARGFSCFHNSCQRYEWSDFAKTYDPDIYESKKRTEPVYNREQKPKPVEPDNGEPTFYIASQVKAKNRENIVSIKTGIRNLDRRIIGLNKGEVSCLSGVNSSGKSSVLSQVSLEAIQEGYRVALFSGELDESRVLNWIQLQASGKQFTMATQYEDFYTVPTDVKGAVNKWLDEKLYIYNNRKGNDIDTILGRMAECISKNKVDLMILDNLMAMDLSLITGDKYEKQSSLIKRIKVFARENDVHVVLVAHPRKTIGFLRKEDISGTADITNVVDNVFIVHRVNTDFVRLSGAMFGWKEGYELYNYSNVIEVCKNRDLGIQDLFVGMHYEVESKRFLNEKYEVRHYGWEDGFVVPMPFD